MQTKMYRINVFFNMSHIYWSYFCCNIWKVFCKNQKTCFVNTRKEKEELFRVIPIWKVGNNRMKSGKKIIQTYLEEISDWMIRSWKNTAKDLMEERHFKLLSVYF